MVWLAMTRPSKRVNHKLLQVVLKPFIMTVCPQSTSHCKGPGDMLNCTPMIKLYISIITLFCLGLHATI